MKTAGMHLELGHACMSCEDRTAAFYTATAKPLPCGKEERIVLLVAKGTHVPRCLVISCLDPRPILWQSIAVPTSIYHLLSYIADRGLDNIRNIGFLGRQAHKLPVPKCPSTPIDGR
jgi:hypothetical protein